MVDISYKIQQVLYSVTKSFTQLKNSKTESVLPSDARTKAKCNLVKVNNGLPPQALQFVFGSFKVCGDMTGLSRLHGGSHTEGTGKSNYVSRSTQNAPKKAEEVTVTISIGSRWEQQETVCSSVVSSAGYNCIPAAVQVAFLNMCMSTYLIPGQHMLITVASHCGAQCGAPCHTPESDDRSGAPAL